VSMLDLQTLQQSAQRNVLGFEQALYMAGSGAHHALAELEADPAWRTGIPAPSPLPPDGNFYSATVADGAGGNVIVTGTGVSGTVTRMLQVTVKFQ